MSNHSVLILDADSGAGLASLQSLGRAGRKIHSAVRTRGSVTEFSRWCHAVHIQPPSLPVDTAVAWLLELDRRHNFVLIIPSTESSLLWLRYLPEDHAVRAKAIIPDNVSIDAALDKERIYEIAQDLGIPVPFSRLITKESQLTQPNTYPLVLKPVRSKVPIGERLFSMSVALVRNAPEWEMVLRHSLPYTDIQEQEWVQGRGVGVEALYDRGKLVWHFVHQRLHEWPLTGGASTLRRSAPDEPHLVQHSRRLLDALNWHGVAMVEWRCASDGRIHLMEINPRLWGSLPLTIAAGINIPEALFALAQGEQPPVSRPWKVGLSARNLTKDIFWCVANARADRTDPMLLTEPPLHSVLGWFHVLSGKEVWDGWSIRDTKVALRELSMLSKQILASLAKRLGGAWLLQRAKHRYTHLLQAHRAGNGSITKVLFLCYGNVCRSPFAASIAQTRWRNGPAVDSAGFHPNAGRVSPQHVVDVAHSLGVDLFSWRSKRVTPAQVSTADLVVVMDLANLDQLVKEFPQAASRAILLGLCGPATPPEIEDPYDLYPVATERVLSQIVSAIESLSCDLGIESNPAFDSVGQES